MLLFYALEFSDTFIHHKICETTSTLCDISQCDGITGKRQRKEMRFGGFCTERELGQREINRRVIREIAVLSVVNVNEFLE